MIFLRRAVAALAFAVFATSSIGCKKKGLGENIPNGGPCRVADPKSTCAPGLYCEETGKMFAEGDTYVSPGNCRQRKTPGMACRQSEECAPPAICSGDPLMMLSGGGMCATP